MEQAQKLLTRSEIARALQVCERTVQRYEEAGLPVVRATPRAAVRYDLAKVTAWLQEQQSA